jgi:hypothetical protein
MRNPSLRTVLPLAIMALIVTAHLATKAMAADDDTRLILQVLTDENKKPVASAHVVVRFISGKKLFIKDKRTTWEAQTNRRGEIMLDDIPKGHVKVQVIAKGYQTFGNEFELTKPEETLTILLKPPAKQVSAY